MWRRGWTLETAAGGLGIVKIKPFSLHGFSLLPSFHIALAAFCWHGICRVLELEPFSWA